MERLDLGRSFTFMFEDSDWVIKLVVGALILLVSGVFSIFLVGFLGFVLLTGYMAAIVRHVARGEELPLPQWENFGDLFVDGLRVGIATFVWSLPALVLAVPIFITSLLAVDGSDAVAAVVTLILLVCGCLLLLYSLFLAVVSPVIILRVAEEQRLSAAFEVGTILGLVRSSIGPIILIIVASWIAQFLALVVGMLVCGVGVLVTWVWALWVQGHLIGQLGRLTSQVPEPA